jgi:hypothetical protein
MASLCIDLEKTSRAGAGRGGRRLHLGGWRMNRRIQRNGWILFSHCVAARARCIR